jgi:hypothetical protein
LEGMELERMELERMELERVELERMELERMKLEKMRENDFSTDFTEAFSPPDSAQSQTNRNKAFSRKNKLRKVPFPGPGRR